MPTYCYSCPACGERFDASAPVARRDSMACLGCATPAARVFRPDWVHVQTPAHLAYTKDYFRPLSTPQHTANYLEGQVLDNHLNKLYAADEAARKNSVPFDQSFWKANPDLNPNQPLTKQDKAELKQVFGGTAGGTHGG